MRVYTKIIAETYPDPRMLTEGEVRARLKTLKARSKDPAFDVSVGSSVDAEQVLRGIARRYRYLSEEEEKFLVRCAKSRASSSTGRMAMDILARTYTRYVMSIAKHFRNEKVPFGDILHEGFIGLTEAVDSSEWNFINFNKKSPDARPSPFRNHAFFGIKRAITKRYSHYFDGHIPEAFYWKMISIKREEAYRGRPGNVRAPGGRNDITNNDREDYVRYFVPHMDRVSLDNDAYVHSYLSISGASDEFTSDAALLKLDLMDVLDRSGLNAQRRFIIERRLGLYDGSEYSQQEVADRLGISKMRVSQEEERAAGAIYTNRAMRALKNAYFEP